MFKSNPGIAPISTYLLGAVVYDSSSRTSRPAKCPGSLRLPRSHSTQSSRQNEDVCDNLWPLQWWEGRRGTDAWGRRPQVACRPWRRFCSLETAGAKNKQEWKMIFFSIIPLFLSILRLVEKSLFSLLFSKNLKKSAQEIKETWANKWIVNIENRWSWIVHKVRMYFWRSHKTQTHLYVATMKGNTYVFEMFNRSRNGPGIFQVLGPIETLPFTCRESSWKINKLYNITCCTRKTNTMGSSMNHALYRDYFPHMLILFTEMRF